MNGMVTINGTDIKEYGATLLAGSYNSLLMPGAQKKYLQNDNRQEDGTSVLVDNPRMAERNATAKFLIKGATQEEFLANYEAFLGAIMVGWVNLYVEDLNATYKLLYASCTSYSHYMLNACLVTITFREPNPTDR